MIYSIQSSSHKVSFKKTGAELCSIVSKEAGTEFMWQGDPNVWAYHAPVLFPIVGELKDGRYQYEGNWYEMLRHGIIRNNEDMLVEKQSGDSIIFLLTSSKRTKKLYPFDFKFRIRFTIKKNVLTITHQVLNLDSRKMLFSLGVHPAFRCPIDSNESYTDYRLEFEHKETAYTQLLNLESGLVGKETELVLDETEILPLHKKLFDRDALIFKELKSKCVSLCSNNKGKLITLRFDDFPYLGIWSKPGADFVCIEPWLGIADGVDHNYNFEEKEGLLELEPNQTFEAAYSIEIHE